MIDSLQTMLKTDDMLERCFQEDGPCVLHGRYHQCHDTPVPSMPVQPDSDGYGVRHRRRRAQAAAAALRRAGCSGVQGPLQWQPCSACSQASQAHSDQIDKVSQKTWVWL